jgi:hypothetical protein
VFILYDYQVLQIVDVLAVFFPKPLVNVSGIMYDRNITTQTVLAKQKLIKERKMTNTNTVITKETTENIEMFEALEKAEEIYSEAYSLLLPKAREMSGYDAKGKLEAQASIVNGRLVTNLKMKFDTPATDMFEEAQRYIFSEFLRMMFERMPSAI